MNDPVFDKGWHAAGQNAALNQKRVGWAAKADREETLAAIREGLADANAGRIEPARTVLGRLAKKHGLTAGD